MSSVQKLLFSIPIQSCPHMFKVTTCIIQLILRTWIEHSRQQSTLLWDVLCSRAGGRGGTLEAMSSDFQLAWRGWQQLHQPPRSMGMSLDVGCHLTTQTCSSVPGEGLALSFLTNDRHFGWLLHTHVDKPQRGCRLWPGALQRWELLPDGSYHGVFAIVVLLPQQKAQQAVARDTGLLFPKY